MVNYARNSSKIFHVFALVAIFPPAVFIAVGFWGLGRIAFIHFLTVRGSAEFLRFSFKKTNSLLSPHESFKAQSRASGGRNAILPNLMNPPAINTAGGEFRLGKTREKTGKIFRFRNSSGQFWQPVE